jgi:hypothetical protein
MEVVLELPFSSRSEAEVCQDAGPHDPWERAAAVGEAR